MMNPDHIRRVALYEYRHEMFRLAVDRYRERLRTRRTLWDMLFPYKVLVIRKGKPLPF